jgi:hypothetical protein
MSWFERVFGFPEPSSHAVTAAAFSYDNGTMTVTSTGVKHRAGLFTNVSLGDLRRENCGYQAGQSSLQVVFGDVPEMLAHPDNKHATFQVRSARLIPTALRQTLMVDCDTC